MESGQDGIKTCEDGCSKEGFVPGGRNNYSMLLSLPFFLNKKNLIGQYVVSKGHLCTWYLSLLIIP